MASLEEWIGLYYSLSSAERVAIAAKTPVSKAKAKPAAPTKRVAKVKQGKKPTIDKLTNPKEKAFFAELKSWRSKVAKDLNQAPYMVFSDKTLMNVSHYTPSTLDELMEINGVGKEKLEKYGDTILELVGKSRVHEDEDEEVEE